MHTQFLANELSFDSYTHNSLDGTRDRDFVVEFLQWSALCSAHHSSMAEGRSYPLPLSLDVNIGPLCLDFFVLLFLLFLVYPIVTPLRLLSGNVIIINIIIILFCLF